MPCYSSEATNVTSIKQPEHPPAVQVSLLKFGNQNKGFSSITFGTVYSGYR
jgi:hypothetical protein